VLRHEGVEVDQRLDAFRHAVGHAGDHDAAVRMAAQDHVRELLGFDATADVANVRFQRDVLGALVGALADAGVGGREDCVPRVAQRGGGLAVAPPAMPGAVHENEIGHRTRLGGGEAHVKPAVRSCKGAFQSYLERANDYQSGREHAAGFTCAGRSGGLSRDFTGRHE
jgi:hypothetical protein